MMGIVRNCNGKKHYGFITPVDGGPGVPDSAFFHISAVCNGDSIPAGAEVDFILVRGRKGPQAASVRLRPIIIPTLRLAPAKVAE